MALTAKPDYPQLLFIMQSVVLMLALWELRFRGLNSTVMNITAKAIAAAVSRLNDECC